MAFAVIALDFSGERSGGIPGRFFATDCKIYCTFAVLLCRLIE
jgi:hypothetical protein